MPSYHHQQQQQQQQQTSATDSNKLFTEVSYEFLGDLSLTNPSTSLSAQNPPKLAHSKSFSKFMPPSKPQQSSQQQQQQSSTTHTPSFVNPFRRTSVSKSFSAFTSRLKQTTSKTTTPSFQQKSHPTTTTTTTTTANAKAVDESTLGSMKINEELLLNTASTASSLSSPTLSTCSNSSMMSSSKNEESLNTEDIVISL
jgi:hypothetical protein